MANTNNMHENDMMLLVAMLWFLYSVTVMLLVWAVRFGTGALRRYLYSTPLRGPSSGENEDLATLTARYGAVFQVPAGAFRHKIVLCDPAAIAHFYANAPGVYRTPDYLRQTTKNLVGRGLAWEEGERHHSHRQALVPLFTEASIEQHFAPVFSEMAQKMQHSWKQDLRTRPRGMIVDIKHWMNCVVIDSLGVAGFGHDFDSLKGGYCIVTTAFHALRAPHTSSFADIIFRLALSYAPSLRALPTAKNRVINDFRAMMSRIAGDVLERSTIKDGVPDTSFLMESQSTTLMCWTSVNYSGSGTRKPLACRTNCMIRRA